MKKIILITGCLISLNAFADILVLSSEHVVTPGLSGNFEVTSTEKKLSEDETNQIRNSELKSFGYTLTAAAQNALGEINKSITIYSNHHACFVNTPGIKL